jgi:tRNA A-37 threonylcarbamoyl transferase component Bud32
MSFVQGENVGPYRIIEQMGQGGMATVFKAYHAALDRYVAIKALHPAMMEDPGFLARFQREAKVVARLDHPNIVPIYDYAEHGGRPYLVMKFIDGETLKARLARSPLSNEEVLRIVEAVGQALTYAHEHGILHRDVKPSNALLSPDGNIYLADFGLARIAEAGASTLSGDMLMGTPHYISPEQARGASDLNECTDIYSFGVVLYELIVGQVPFDSDTPFSIIHDHIYTPLPLPCDVNPNVSESVQRVLLKALAKDREDRYKSVDEMVAAFRATTDEGDVGVLIPDTTPRIDTTMPVRTHGEPVVPAAVVPPTEPQRDVAPEIAQAAVPSPEPMTKGRRQWFWVVGGLVLTCIFFFVFLAVVNRSRDGLPLGDLREPVDKELEITAPREFVGEQNPEQHLNQAEEFLAAGDDMAATKEFAIAGELFLEVGEYVAAVKAYNRAVEISDRPLPAQHLLIDSLTQALFLGAPEEAMLSYIEPILEEYPDWVPIQVVMARARLNSGHHDEALGMIERVLGEAPEDPLALVVLVEYYLEIGEFDEGRELISKLLSGQRLPVWLTKHLEALKRRF